MLSDCPQLETNFEIASKLCEGLGCYFFLLRLSIYDRATNITSNKVKTSIVFIGHHPPYVLEGIVVGNASASFCSIMKNIVAWFNGDVYVNLTKLELLFFIRKKI